MLASSLGVVETPSASEVECCCSSTCMLAYLFEVVATSSELELEFYCYSSCMLSSLFEGVVKSSGWEAECSFSAGISLLKVLDLEEKPLEAADSKCEPSLPSKREMSFEDHPDSVTGTESEELEAQLEPDELLETGYGDKEFQTAS
ncbi:hypothetical protein O181_016772 [Austropuccinia psidii MF-1]|uniref:Uncharacterized protein n=1 Tax=Austropuccinia psidii MF-1 TaxID=1389203 RepID=A0A9Q3GS02_9BASI|nr:hypothetical protein [Austropuccinia psidii MF-1]